MTEILGSEVGPRDGLQSIDRVMPLEAKKAWIAAEAAAGPKIVTKNVVLSDGTYATQTVYSEQKAPLTSDSTPAGFSSVVWTAKPTVVATSSGFFLPVSPSA